MPPIVKLIHYMLAYMAYPGEILTNEGSSFYSSSHLVKNICFQSKYFLNKLSAKLFDWGNNG